MCCFKGINAEIGYLVSNGCAVLGYVASKGCVQSLDISLQRDVSSPGIPCFRGMYAVLEYHASKGCAVLG
jgi:hypothetical protein